MRRGAAATVPEARTGGDERDWAGNFESGDCSLRILDAKLAYDDDDANQDMFAMICTGRTLARIFHGINSPAFPAQFWSTSSHWKRYADYNFDHVLALCNRVAKKAKAHLVA